MASDSKRQKYVVGFTVHEAKELSHDGTAIDPLCLVRALGREYRTDLKKGKLQHVKFNESYIWSDVFLTEDEFNMSFIDFELQAANIWTRNETLGTARVQLAMVRKRPNHTYVQKWLQLTNAAQLSAKLKVTVFCYGQGDDPPRPEDLENDQEETERHLEDLGAAVLGDTQGKANQFMQAYHLFVQVHRAEHLGGGFEKFNPYVSVEFNGHKLETPPAKDTHTLMFDECFRMPVTMPLFADSILIRVWNKRKWQADEIIVQGRLSFSLLRMHALAPKWFNFYGFSSKEVGDVKALTSHGEPAEENTYLGRLLISGRVQKVPRMEDLHKAAAIKGHVVEEPPAASMTFLLDVSEISGCPGSEAYVEISLGAKSKATRPAPRTARRRGAVIRPEGAAAGPEEEEDDDDGEDISTPGRFRFKPGEGKVMPVVAVVPTDASNQLDVILSIYAKLGQGLTGAIDNEPQRVGFARIKTSTIKDWTGETPPPFWVTCRPMAHLPSSVEPGAILCSLAKSGAQVKERGVANVKPLAFELRCYVCMARGLVSQSNEVPSPFCQVSCAGTLARTNTASCTTAPSWGQCVRMPIELQCSLETLRVQPEPIQVVVYDEVEEKSVAADLRNLVGADGTADLNRIGALGTKAMQGIGDRIGGLTGDVMAKKRLGAVVNGRRVIGRAQISFKDVLRPPAKKTALEPQWVKLKGGLLGSHHVGDILVGFELMKRKYVKDFPVKSTTPQGKACTLSVSVLGLRNVAAIHGAPVEKPKLQAVVSSLSGEDICKTIEWSSKPAKSLTADDTNRSWSVSNRKGFEFLTVFHLDVVLPRFAVWEPNVRFRLLDGGDGDAFLAEGRVSLAERIPWVKPGKGRKAVQAQDEFLGDAKGAFGDGVPVSDAEDDDGSNYFSLEVTGEAAKIGFNSGDSKTFPPVIVQVTPEGPAHKAGVKPGDWLVALAAPQDAAARCAAGWSPAKAAKSLFDLDKKLVRPLTLRFRRKDKSESTVRLLPGQETGLSFVMDADVSPPKISKDTSSQKFWKKQGIGAGWRVVDVNGTDTKNMTAVDKALSDLLETRPAVVTCRPHGIAAPQSGGAEDLAVQMQMPVLLSGVPTRVYKEHEHKLSHRDGCMSGTTVPRPSLYLPPVTDTKRLNMYVARSACMDVRGVIKHVISGKAGDEGDATRTRASVAGKLEDSLEPPSFAAVGLMNGPNEVGQVKVCYKVVSPRDPDWVKSLKDPNDPERMLFDEARFRKKYKVDQPHTLRIRTYVIRGLNVSGAVSGYGNPYLFFTYGTEQVWLEGHRQLNTVDPRFFRTEERDIHIPEQAHFEVGLYDWQENGEDQLIGKSVVDLEDRWFTPTFQVYMKQNKVPIEYRPLEQDVEGSGSLCKGSLEMWIELLDAAAAAEFPTSTLVQPPAVEVELRAVVYSVRNMSLRLCVDDETGDERERVDVMVRCSIDCRSFLGPQPREQETDIHYGSEGSGEFNWRFVFSRVAVTPGVPLDCFLQFSVWEQFALRRPQLLCENLVEMKNYCKKVSSLGELLQIEAELPLQNKLLSRLLAKEMEGKQDDELSEGAAAEDSGEEQALEEGLGIEQRAVEIPPAALMKVLVQVVPQTQASSSDQKVGLGRNDPNRNPILSYPQSGRSWESVLPTAAKVIESVIEGISTGKRRCKLLTVVMFVVLIVGALHYFKNPKSGCPYIQQSCKMQSTCQACACCNHLDVPDAKFCYYGFLGSADKMCAGASFQAFCNAKESTCTLQTGSCVTANDCFKAPRPKTPVIPAARAR